MSRRGREIRRRRRIVVSSIAVVLVVVLVLVGGYGWYRMQLRAGSGPHTPVTLEIAEGSSTGAIASQLAAADVVRNARAFELRIRSTGAGPFEAGRYRFTRNSSADAAIDVLAAGPMGPEIVKVSIPEGFRLDQIIDRIAEAVPRFDAESIRAALSSGEVRSALLPAGSDDWEGLLFPATYDVTADDTVVGLLQEMADEMTAKVDGLDPDPAVTDAGLTDYEVVIVASLVQAEAGNPDEAAKIARVIYNRLASGEALGIDATSGYLALKTGDDVDYESTSPYNTRRQPGLPPTPIGSPGDFALQAAAHPAEGDWVWYVRDVNDDAQGRPQHVFTASAEEFEAAKRACYEADLGCGPP